MPFVEVITRRGSLSEPQRTLISQDLAAQVMAAEGAPDTEAARSISWLVLHEVDTWVIGGRPVDESEPPRFLVRVAVPAGSLNDDRRSDMVERITRVLAQADDDPERLYQHPMAWVHINEVPDGNWGARGQIVRLADIATFVTTGSVTSADGAA
jgi:phenylpyruvate tautomerase PptA (4-oxalocrotonate tautomerase family)